MNIDEAIEFIGNLCLEYRSKGMEEPLTENYEKYTPVADKLNNVKALLIEIKAKKPPKDYSEAYNKGHTEGYQEGVSKSIEQGIKIGKSLVLDILKETFDDFLEDMESD
jgi:flagellar biosynthesis/type III secretory pathway protein FliH